MVLQHNLPGLNAKRIYNKNSTKLSKSLEKLSSGYSINRAADDASGLAVSEKMRSQIFGMEQSVKNCQDGISLIQTFEGALDETSAIIERMKTLADQSANGTYDDAIDRAALEAEYTQLRSEIDQIADTDFNGLVMLNGRRMADEFTYLGEKGTEWIIPKKIELRNCTSSFEYSEGNKMSIKLLPEAAEKHVDSEVFLALVDLEKRAVINADLIQGIPTYSFAVASDGWLIENDPDDIQSGIISYRKSSGEVLDLAKVTMPLIHNASTTGFGMLDTSHIVHHQSMNGQRYSGCQIGIYITQAASSAEAFDEAVKYRDNPVDFITDTKGTLYNKKDENDPNRPTITYDDLRSIYGIEVSEPGKIADGSLFNINGSINIKANGRTISPNVKAFSDDYMKKVFISANHTIEYTYDGTNWKDAGGKIETALNGYNTAGKVNGDKMKISVETIKEQFFDGFYYNPNTPNLELTLDESAVDYSKAIDGEGYTYDGTNWIKRSTNQAVDLKNEGINLPAGIKLFIGMRFTVSNVLAGPTGNVQAGVKLFTSALDIFRKKYENLTYADDVILQSGARTKDAVNFTFDYSTDGIGDLKADLDCTALGLGLDGLTLSVQDDANFAIDKLDHALNKVSLIRATFGAVQNRLEHKIDNLNNTKENLTYAESGIRDANMAKEMMDFTKNQILTQSSQSMLAQANSLPQNIISLISS